MTPGLSSSVLFDGRVMHHRLLPREHRFSYGVFYQAEDIGKVNPRLQARDHGYRDGTPLKIWANSILARAGVEPVINRVVLMAMPRVLGYVFNPISFWFCLDENGRLRALLCEVNNTFGEHHTYVCCHPDHRVIQSSDWLEGEKVFHVSPFMDRQGNYRFQFSLEPERLVILINYFDETGRLKLRTSLSGKWMSDTLKHRIYLRLRHPLVTMTTIGLIHYHAVRLALKKIGYRAKPGQSRDRLSFVQGTPASNQSKLPGGKH